MLEQLLLAVEKLGRKIGMAEDLIVTAQSIAWYWWSRSRAFYAVSHWARIGVRQAISGRDLPWCGTGPSDALRHSVQGAGMGEVMDKTPPPDVLADHRERYNRIMVTLTATKRTVVNLRVKGIDVHRIALAARISDGRVSQIAREVWESWKE